MATRNEIKALIDSYITTNGIQAITGVKLNEVLQSIADFFIHSADYDTDGDGIVDKSETLQITARNSTGSTITKGTAVYISGATGNRPNIILAQADADATADTTIGIVVADILNNADGQVCVNGTLHDLDTSAFTEGDLLYLSSSVAGGLQNTRPASPNHAVFIGYVARVHATLGRLVINIDKGNHLEYLHDVLLTTLADKHFLYYDSASGLWKNKQLVYGDVHLQTQDVSSSVGITPASNIDFNKVMAQAEALTIANPNGTFVEGQSFILRIKDNGTARALTFDTKYRAIGITLPTTTTASKTMYLGIIYNATDDKFDVLGFNEEA